MKFLKNIFCKKCKLISDLKEERESLTQLNHELKNNCITDYLNKNIVISADEIKFDNVAISECFAKHFYDFVKDTENCVVMQFRTHLGDGVDVIIAKEGRLAPVDKLKLAEEEILELKKALKKYKDKP